MTLKSINYDEKWMQYALRLAKLANEQGEVPVGAIIVHEQQSIAEGWNQSITHTDPTAHAEIVSLRKAAKYFHNYRLADTSLYVTLEPCVMCAGAILQARIKRVVFGAYDARAGAAGSRFDILRDMRHNHQLECIGGVLEAECKKYLTDFFKEKRDKNR
ncbi:MAG: tRNA adenosine(34) deaminase TadA [Thiomargarita sp.]|nr:tRNA adenosine(34) deaminase TadA [Thiomargarita sp.]